MSIYTKKRLLIFVEGGVVQDVYTPDTPEQFEVLLKDVDNDEGEQVVELGLPSELTEAEWEKYVKEVK